MKDRTLITLAGLAEELAEFERSAVGAIRVHEGPGVGRSPRRLGPSGGDARQAIGRRLRRIGAAAGAVVALGLAAASWVAVGPLEISRPRPIDPSIMAMVAVAHPWSAPSGPRGGSSSLSTPEAGDSAAPSALAVLPAVVLSIFRDLNGDCSCLAFERIDTAEAECAREGGGAWLAHSAMKRQCMAEPAEVLVVKMTGPADRLPLTYADAAALADCLGGVPDDCGTDPACISASASMCIDPSVNVVAQVLPFGARQ